MTTTTDTASVSTAVDVEAPIERAFHVFTVEIGTWWDADKHILAAPLAEMVFEPRVGGHIIDRGTDGSECRWARVLAYEPPRRVCFSWDINTRWEIESDPAKTSEVEITFTELTPQRTRVVLTHRHLDRHGSDWRNMRDAVSSGWSLAGFAAAVGQPDPSGQVLGRTLPPISDETMRARRGAARPYTAIVLHKTTAYVRPDVDPIVWEHGRRNMALGAAGLLPIVLPSGGHPELAGLAIFALTPEDARIVMDDDPGVRAGIFGYDLYPVLGFPGSTLP